MLEPKAETMPRPQLAKLQLERLKKTLHNAYKNVPAVKQRFEEAGVKPDDVKHLEDIVRLPLTTKKDLFENYPFGLFAVPREKLVRIHASSGTTTGRPTVVGYTRQDLNNWSGLVARSMACGGVRPGDILHNAFGYGLFTGGLGMHYGGERLGCTVVPMSGGNTHRQIVALKDLGATVISATPSYSLHLAEVAEQEGFDLRSGSLRLGIFGAEPWTEAMRTELEARLGLTAVDIYGLSEIMGPGVAGECIEARRGLHGWEDHFLFEIVDLETGEPLPPGKTGELVITTLTKQALPMIRYRTRDITSIDTGRCACGRTHMRIRKLSGRTDDMMIIRGVNVYPSQIEEVLVGFPNVAPHYQLVIRREGPMDTLQVETEALPEVTVETYATLADQVTYHIKSKIGVTCQVEVKEPGAVPRFEGKAIRVRDLRNM
jgi:phenylacetate-CoA ligase